MNDAVIPIIPYRILKVTLVGRYQQRLDQRGIMGLFIIILVTSTINPYLSLHHWKTYPSTAGT